MASGSFEFATGNSYITGRIQWSSTSNGSVANSSNVSATLSFKKSSSSTSATYGSFSGTVTIDGTSTSFSSRINLNPNNSWVTVGTANKLVYHNSDGSKSIWIESTGGIPSLTFQYKNKGQTAVLDNIPRASSVSGGSGDIGDEATIRIDRKSTNFTHALYYQIGSDGWVTIATGVTTQYYTWTIPTSFYSRIPNSNSLTGTIICETYNNGTFIGDTTTSFTARVTGSNPIIGTYSYADTNATTTAITEDDQRIIRNNSNLVFTLGIASGQNSAKISKYAVSFNGITKSRTNSGTLDFGKVNISQSARATITITDSRGNTSTEDAMVVVDDWETPTGIINCQRQSNYYTETIIKVDSKYSSLNNKNAVTIQCQYKKPSESAYSALQTLQDHTESTLLLDNKSQWEVRVIVSDKIGSTTYNLSIDEGIPIVFFDRSLRSVGINCFPTKSSSIESNGLAIDDLIYVGSQELYSSFSTSEAGTTSLLGTYDKRLLNGIFTGITIPDGYVRAYRVTAQVQTVNENTVTVYINNIATSSTGSWSGPTFRYILGSRIFKEDEVTLEETFNYPSRQGTNLKVNNSASYLCNVYAITLHAYLVKSSTNTSSMVTRDYGETT